MPDPGRWWHVLGRLLPADVRERIYEPAFGDMLRAWLTAPAGSRRTPFVVRALGTWLGCLAIGVPRWFVRDRKLTRLGQASAWALVLLVTLALVVANMRQAYAGMGP